MIYLFFLLILFVIIKINIMETYMLTENSLQAND